MNYTGFLISSFATGLDNAVQPWLLPDEAQFQLFDGFVYRGVWQKREGYSQFATGERGSAPYCESRMIHRITGASTSGAINSSNRVFTATLSTPVRRGSVTVVGTVPVQSFTDNGLGAFTSGGATGTINYQTGALSITLPVAPTAGSVTVTYDVHQGFPVMGVMNFFTQTNTRQLIVADTTYVNRFNPNTNRLDDISPTTLLTGNNTNFCSWTNYPDPNGFQRLLFVNNKDPIQQYSGSTVTVYPLYTGSTQITAAAFGTGNGTQGPYTFTTPANTGVVPGSVTITAAAQNVTDNQFGTLQGDGTGTVNYLSGAFSVTFNANVPGATPITITYKQLNTPIETCLHIFQFKDRLVALFPTEPTAVKRGLRIRISGTGAMGDVFTTDAIGAGFIDIPDNTFISASNFNRDSLLIFTELSTWTLQYTGNDVVPFTLNRIDESRGSSAPYGSITYLNRTNAASPRGLILTDGYSVVRSDDKIPEYSFNQISQAKFNLCYAGSVDEDRDHYLIHPSPGQSKSDRILVTNYEEDNYAVYRIPLSSMGNFIGAFEVTWNDLTIYNTWDELAAVYGNWNSFAYSEGAPFAIGGGHNGEIVRLNMVETEDYPVKIRNATVIDGQTLQLTTDFQNYALGDYVFMDGLAGMVQANDKQAPISQIVADNYTFNLSPIDTTTYASYTGSGLASKVINFSTKTKKFNPFAEQDKKVRCGWVYFYVSTTGTNVTENQSITFADKTDPCVITVPNNGYKTGDFVTIDGVVGMTQLNGLVFSITVIDDNNFSLDGVDATGYTDYVSGGFCATPVNAKLQVRVITNDTEQSTQLNTFNPAPYEVNLTNLPTEVGIKKWYKLFVNQIGRFIQFEFGNNQAGAKIEIQAVMPGFAGLGRLI